MKDKGYKQGDMTPEVDDYQKPMASYSQADANKTTEYISRKDKQEEGEASDIRKQAYKGRYS